MKLYRPFAVALFSLFLCVSVFAQKMVFQGNVIDVLDGSTIVVETPTATRFSVRCVATTAPQRHEFFGDYSRERLSKLVMGQTVTVEYTKAPEKGLIVGTILLNGQDICLDQIRMGAVRFNRDNEFRLSSSARDVYAAREARARQNGVGLWGISPGPKTSDLNNSAIAPATAPPKLTGSQSAPGHAPSSTGSPVNVGGYVRKDGTYVAPHKRTAPDEKFENNWSTVGNVNPYTRKPGTKSWFSRNWWIFPTVGALIGTSYLLRNSVGGSGIPCNDGTISRAQNRQGACSHHGGIR